MVGIIASVSTRTANAIGSPLNVIIPHTTDCTPYPYTSFRCSLVLFYSASSELARATSAACQATGASEIRRKASGEDT